MKTITLSKKDIHKGSLILVNKSYPLVKYNDEKSGLRVIDHFPDICLESTTASVLSHMFVVLNCHDEIIPVSGYRTFEEQKKIYEDSLKENGNEFTDKYVALPNHSEHQTGLAIDLALKQNKINFICPSFPYDGVCAAFREKAPYYGFIERYQKEKDEITGIAHEPWHFRYVGYPHSMIIKKYNFVLEEYIDFLKQFPYEGGHFITEINGLVVEIFYVEASCNEIHLPEDTIYQISGNNVDGFIVTVWR